jgi:two-component system phosphate regulon sensor histidine kinase PhoR
VGRLTLATRVFASTAVVLVAALGVFALVGEMRLRAFHAEELERRLDAVALLLEADARAALGGDGASTAARRAALAARGLAAGVRVTVLDAGGEVVVETDAALPVANHADRPEIVAAAAAPDGRGSDARRSATTGVTTLYRAWRLDGPAGVAGFVRVGAAADAVDAEVATFRRSLALAAAGLLVLGLFAAAIVARRLARPLEEMRQGAAALAAGDLDRRILVDGPEEVRALAGSLNRMADDLRARIAAERGARTELEAVLAGMAEGVVAVDRGERLLFLNAAGARMLGLGEGVAPGADLWRRLRFPSLEDALRRGLAGKPSRVAEAPEPSGSGRLLELSVTPLPPPAGGAVALLRDVTEVRRLERMRMDFVANVSHELRTPLAGVSGALETLEEPDDDPAVRARFLAIARRNATRLQELVADLLELSSIEAEGMSMPLERVPLDRPVRAAVQSIAALAARKGVELVLETVPAGDLGVAAHERRIEQAVTNLVENAVKYTPAAGRVAVRLRPGDAEIAVEVEDSGIGIPTAALPRVFERFFRVDPSRSRDQGGTGLGLAIVKHIARAHRGRVDVRSEEGRGSTFVLALPRPGRGAPPPD